MTCRIPPHLKKGGAPCYFSVAISGLELLTNPKAVPIPEPKPIDPNRVGNNVERGKALFFGLHPETSYDDLLTLPMGRVRIAARMNEVVTGLNQYNFSPTRELIEKALKEGKVVDLQLGMKTFGGREVNLPPGMFKDYPYLANDNVVLDRDSQVQKIVLDYLHAASIELLKPFPEIATLHVENEALEKRLEVTRGRHLSQDFLLKEVHQITDEDPYHRPIVQNANWDTPEAALWLLTRPEFNIIATNIYNNTSQFFRPFLWKWIDVLQVACLAAGKKFGVAEYQASYWLEDGRPKYPLSVVEFKEGYDHSVSLNPEFFHFWDVYQVISKKDQDPKMYEVYSFLVNQTRLYSVGLN